jgi:hypothetical protein
MDKYEISKLIEKHGNYRYIFMNEEELRTELKKWCRQDLICWLKWNDPNGIYEDNQSIKEIGCVMSYEVGVEIMIEQIIQKNA